MSALTHFCTSSLACKHAAVCLGMSCAWFLALASCRPRCIQPPLKSCSAAAACMLCMCSCKSTAQNACASVCLARAFFSSSAPFPDAVPRAHADPEPARGRQLALCAGPAGPCSGVACTAGWWARRTAHQVRSLWPAALYECTTRQSACWHARQCLHAKGVAERVACYEVTATR